MATREAVARRMAVADGRVGAAVETMATALSLGLVEPPTFGRGVAPEYRAMTEREALAETLERLAAVVAAGVAPGAVTGATDGTGAGRADADGADGATGDAEGPAGPGDGGGEDAPVDAAGERSRGAKVMAGLTRGELDGIAAAAGIEDWKRLPNKGAVIAAIVAAAETADGTAGGGR